MTREIMINQLKDLKCHCEEMAKYDLLESPWRKDAEALEMAIKALEQETILEKIRADINNLTVFYTTKDKGTNLISQRAVNRVFDKYRKRGKGMSEYKPLTPSFRQDINIGFDKAIADLQTCKPNALVNAQIEALRTYKRLINGLPDGYPMPLAGRK